MDLDRQSIEKRDFPIGRRGYEPVAVDQHLAAIAREVEALKQAKAREPAPEASDAAAPVRQAPESLASFASVQVQAIVEAAEASASAIESEARESAQQTAKDAAGDAERTRQEAVERSQEHVGKVREATSLMLKRLGAMETELGDLIESLRAGTNSLNGELTTLSAEMDDLYAAAGRSDEPPGAELAEADLDDDDEDVVATDDAGEADDGDRADGVGRGDVEAARLVALNMALNGQSRKQTDSYLAENFDLTDRGALLDEVYATVGG